MTHILNNEENPPSIALNKPVMQQSRNSSLHRCRPTIESLVEPSNRIFHAFPSPRTWHATKNARVGVSLSESYVESEKQSELEEEMAEWIAKSCIAEDSVWNPKENFEEESNQSTISVYSTPASVTPTPSNLGPCKIPSRGGTCGSFSSGRSWASSSSCSGSEGASPTSVLAETSSEWDLLFAAAGKVQKLALEQERAVGRRGPQQPRSLQHILLTSGSPPKSGKPGPAANSRPVMVERSPLGNPQNFLTGDRSQGGKGAPEKRGGLTVVETRRDDGVPVVTLINHKFNNQEASLTPGTGVFIPRSGSISVPVSARKPTKALVSKKVHKPATVILPPHLIKSLGLNVDQDNNVLLHKRPIVNYGKSDSGRTIPIIKAATTVIDCKFHKGRGDRHNL